MTSVSSCFLWNVSTNLMTLARNMHKAKGSSNDGDILEVIFKMTQ